MTPLKKFYAHVAEQPCYRCGARPVEVAHIRGMAALKHEGAMSRRKGLSEYSAIALCPNCHRHARDSIHAVGEERFFESLGRPACHVYMHLARSIAEALA